MNPTQYIEIPEQVLDLYTGVSKNLRYPIQNRMDIRKSIPNLNYLAKKKILVPKQNNTHRICFK